MWIVCIPLIECSVRLLLDWHACGDSGFNSGYGIRSSADTREVRSTWDTWYRRGRGRVRELEPAGQHFSCHIPFLAVALLLGLCLAVRVS
jgi:hypothetical protein